MYSLDVKNACRCFLRDGMSEHEEFSTKDEAKVAAESMLSHMQDNFCKKHKFMLDEKYGSYVISIVDRNA